MKRYISIFFLFLLLFSFKATAQDIETYDAADLQIALQKLNVLGSVLYLAAHPDDENTAALAYFSKGRKYRTAYLSLTRGDGGQNLIGSEKGVEIGILRTQELLAARRIDKAEQFFTRAIDFGYSKTPEETFIFWDKEKILSDIVWAIRTFRPDVIITRFSTDSSSGHGHHTASGILVKEAFQAAADPKRFPEQLKYVQPWKAKRLYWNTWRPSQQEIENLQRINTGEYNPLLGKSYSEIAAESRSQHKSQGFGAEARRGIRFDYFDIVAGTPASEDLFDGIDTTWNRVPGGQKVGALLDKIITSFDPQEPSQSISGLLNVYNKLNTLEKGYWIDLKQQELLQVIQSCAGLWMEAIADDFAAAPGDEIKITFTLINRSDSSVTLEKISCPEAVVDLIKNIPLNNNEAQSFVQTIRLPMDIPISQPYWLQAKPKKGYFLIEEQKLRNLAENPPSVQIKVSLRIDGHPLEYTIPLLYHWRDRVDGELYRLFEIRPAVTVQMENSVYIFANENSREIKVKLISHSPNISGYIRLNGNQIWETTPESIPFTLKNKYDEQEVTFKVSPPKYSNEAVLTAQAEVGDRVFNRAFKEISYPHIKRQVYFPLSSMNVVKLDIKKTGNKLGYIMGAGDDVTESLQSLGYEVVLLTDEMLERTELSQFDAVITGIRAYNTRERLRHTQDRLLQYVENGGTLIVQYNVSYGLQTEKIGPYPFSIGRDRVSMEDAPIIFVNPDHPLLNYPNKITQKDFEGWIQERGLYFAEKWDEKYETILSSHDTNESDNKGGLLFTRYGKGVFIYTGFSWFRQLPAGIPGAFRIFANLISAASPEK